MEYQPDISALGLVNFVPLPDRTVPIEQAANRPLSEGQKLHVDHLLSIEDDTMVRDMLIGIRRDGIPPKKYLNDYLSQLAEWSWDEISDERTLELLDTVRQSDWDKWLGQADLQLGESMAQDLANDAKLSLLQSAYNNDRFETLRIAVQLLNDESPEVRAWAKLAILEYEYGIILSTQRAQGDNTIKGWSYQAIGSVFEAVQDTIDAMWTIRDKLDPYAIPQDRASFFRGVVGHLDIRLAVEGPAYYAETFAYDPDGFRDNNYNITSDVKLN